MASLHTLYARNLNEKVSLNKLENELKKMFLENGFSVLDIKVFKKLALRGQAYISFRENVKLENVIDSLNTKLLFDKPIILEVAKQESDVVVERINSKSDYEQHIQSVRPVRLQKRQANATDKKRRRSDADDNDGDKDKPASKDGNAAKKQKVIVNSVPNKMMILVNLSKDVKQQDLIDLLEVFDGFLTVNYVSVRRLALIEFETEQDAIKCYKALGPNVTIKGETSSLSYAKK